MKTRKRTKQVAVAACLFLAIPAAHAENWVRVIDDGEEYTEVDADSIRKKDDGLVYYYVQNDILETTAAADCEQHILYVIGKIENWRSRGHKVPAGDPELDFVCARAK
jgi:hypothetical protein